MFAGALSLVMITAISVVDYLPTSDGPNTIVNGYLRLHLDDAGKGYAHFLRPNTNPTSLAFDLPFVTLLRFMPWREALSATLCFGALLWAWGFFALLAALEPRRLALSAFGFATALCWAFYMGFFSFWISSGVALLVLALAVAWKSWSASRLAVLGAGVFVVALGHTFPAMIVGLTLVALALARAQTARQRVRALLQLALAGVPSLVIVALASLGSSSNVASDAMQDEPLRTIWLPFNELLTMPARYFTAGPLWRSLPPPLLALAGLLLAFVRVRRARTTPEERALLGSACLLLLASSCLPISIEIWKLFSPRFVPYWVLFGIALLPVEDLPTPRARALLRIGSVGFALAALFWSTGYHLRLADHEADALALADAKLQRSGTRLPLVLRASLDEVVAAEPSVNTPLLYVIGQGGMVPDLFATQPAVHPHLYRATRDKLFPRFPGRFYGTVFRLAGSGPGFPPKEAQLTWAALLGSAYDDVILISDPADADAFIARGYAVDARRGDAAIVRYRGCGLRLDIRAAAPASVPLFVEYGWTPLFKPVHTETVPAGSVPPLHVDFPSAPCGPVWVRVSWDDDHSGGPSPGDSHCNEAGALDMVLVEAKPGQQTVTCTAKTAPAAL